MFVQVKQVNWVPEHERQAFEAHLAQEESNSKDFVKIADDGKTYVSS